MRYLLLLLPLLTGCASTGKHIPETIVLNTGTSVKHEPGEMPAKVNTLNLNITWRLK